VVHTAIFQSQRHYYLQEAGGVKPRLIHLNSITKGPIEGINLKVHNITESEVDRNITFHDYSEPPEEHTLSLNRSNSTIHHYKPDNKKQYLEHGKEVDLGGIKWKILVSKVELEKIRREMTALEMGK